MTGKVIGPYQILAKLGEGGMGEVYRAADSNLKRSVAIKVLPATVASDPDRLARFQREAEVLAALNHPNIAAIYGVEKTPDLTALVMELVEGEDLSAHIARGPIPVSDALPIARQIADALEAAHELGIVHRDLKPANIKVRTDGTVKVLDFGLAKALDPDAGRGSSRAGVDAATMTSPAMTAMGMILGTAAYMSPEQARGRPVDRRADIWAFGVVLFEMLAGQRAFEGDDVSITLANVLKEDVKWSALPADMPSSVQRLLRRCLEKDPRRRLSAIGDARLEIEDALSGRAEIAPAPAGPVTPVVPAWRRALPWAVAAVAVIAAIVAALTASDRSSASAPVWTSIPAPVDLLSRRLGPTVSPDGRRIAFVASDGAGSEHLWVRELDAQASQMIAGTEGAGWPFWSATGERIGFFKDQKIQIITPGVGAPQILADALNPRGATWNRDDVIVFVPHPGQGLYRVSASSGGAAVPVDTSIDQSVNLSSYPSFLPDGQRFLYTSVKEGEAWINVGSLSAATSTPVLKAFSRAEYANGYLLFASKGALYAQPFDPSTLALSGERKRLLDTVGQVGGNTQAYAFSATSDVIAAGNGLFVAMSQLTWFDATGARLGALGEAGQIFGFSVSPDRSRAVIERNDPRVNSVDPWIVELKSGFTTPLRAMAEGALASGPIWSHDSQRVYYGSGYGILRSVSPAGGEETAWTVGSHWPMSSSRDGTSILISKLNELTGNDLMLVSVAGDHAPVPLIHSSFNENSGRISPDGTSVAYISNESNRNEVYVQSFPTPGNKFRVSAAGGTHPEWSEDGKQVYFLGPAPNGKSAMMVADVTAGSASAPRKLFDMPPGSREQFRSQFAVFENGRRFLINVDVPITAPQVITIGQNWAQSLKK